MKKEFKNKTEMYQFVIDNWMKYESKELAEIVGVSPNYIRLLGTRMRKRGVDLPRKSEPVNWGKLK
jgi:transposase